MILISIKDFSVNNQSIDWRYLDHLASAPCKSTVIQRMLTVMTECPGNASSPHRYGYSARKIIDEGRAVIASTLGCSARELYLTSGATEANQMVFFGLEQLYPKSHIITQVTEHSAVLKPCEILESRGHEVTRISVDHSGLVDLDQFFGGHRVDPS